MTPTSLSTSPELETTLADKLKSTTLDVDEISFHPDFNEPTTETIFQTPDGTSFRFSWPILAAMSSFFDVLRSVPNNDGGDNVIIPLPSATAPALACVFDAIKAVLRGKPLDRCPPVAHWDDILKVADTHDLPFATFALYASAKNDDCDKFNLFALAVLVKDAAEITRLSGRLLENKMLGFRDSWAEHVLRSKAPLAIAQLHAHYASWVNQLDSFAIGDFPRSYHHFGRKCGKPRTICANVELWEGDFHAFLCSVLVKIKISLFQSPCVLAHSAYMLHIELGCDECNRRIAACVSNGIHSILRNRVALNIEF